MGHRRWWNLSPRTSAAALLALAGLGNGGILGATLAFSPADGHTYVFVEANPFRWNAWCLLASMLLAFAGAWLLATRVPLSRKQRWGLVAATACVALLFALPAPLLPLPSWLMALGTLSWFALERESAPGAGATCSPSVTPGKETGGSPLG
jgi:hypothetical protein